MGVDELRKKAQESMKAGGSGGGSQWHRWSDSNEVSGTYKEQGEFTRQDGTSGRFIVLTKEDGGDVKVGMDYAVLRSEWSDASPEIGDFVFIMRGAEKVQSSAGREYWPFGVSIEKGDGAPAQEGEEDEIPF